jgi:hypothetical protein
MMFDPQHAAPPEGPDRCDQCHELRTATHPCACDGPVSTWAWGAYFEELDDGCH